MVSHPQACRIFLQLTSPFCLPSPRTPSSLAADSSTYAWLSQSCIFISFHFSIFQEMTSLSILSNSCDVSIFAFNVLTTFECYEEVYDPKVLTRNAKVGVDRCLHSGDDDLRTQFSVDLMCVTTTYFLLPSSLLNRGRLMRR